MKLLVHDLSVSEWDQVADNYKDWMVISNTGTVRPCIGCFHCWTSGSGACVFKDGYDRMCALIHEADEMVIMSRYTYGGFSSFVKNVFDRSIGYVLPEFETAYGEMHHKKRFPEDKQVTFRFRGSNLSEEEKEKARKYVAAVCRNLRGTVKEVIFDECALEEKPVVPADEPAKRSGILLLNCSLRGKNSNTGAFLKKLRKDLGADVKMVSLSIKGSPERAAEAVSKAETVVFGVPLFVDGLPAQALRLMEKVKESGNPCRFYAVVNNGLYESRQNENMLSMIKDFCHEKGFQYGGGLAIGAGEVVGLLMQNGRRSLWPARNAKMGLARLAEAINEGSKIEDLYVDPFLFPRWLYILIANVNWQRLKKAAKRS